jgi:hypothetical protein
MAMLRRTTGTAKTVLPWSVRYKNQETCIVYLSGFDLDLLHPHPSVKILSFTHISLVRRHVWQN